MAGQRRRETAGGEKGDMASQRSGALTRNAGPSELPSPRLKGRVCHHSFHCHPHAALGDSSPFQADPGYSF